MQRKKKKDYVHKTILVKKSTNLPKSANNDYQKYDRLIDF